MRRIDTAFHLLPSVPVLLFGWLILPAPLQAQSEEAEVVAVVVDDLPAVRRGEVEQ
mgnify:CR=1 FL=1